MTNIDLLQVRIAMARFVPWQPDAVEGRQELFAVVESPATPLSGQVWEELELTGRPWTVKTLRRTEGRPQTVILKRPASECDRQHAPGQVLDLVRHGPQRRADWTEPSPN